MISKTQISAQKLRKTARRKSVRLQNFLVQTTLSNNDISKMLQVLTVILPQNWCLSQRGAIDLSASSSLQIHLTFTALPGSFSNVVRMRTRSLWTKHFGHWSGSSCTREIALSVREVQRVAGSSSSSSWQLSVTTIYLYMLWNHYYTINAVSSPGGVVTCTLQRIIFNRLLDLDVTEININFEINIKSIEARKFK